MFGTRSSLPGGVRASVRVRWFFIVTPALAGIAVGLYFMLFRSPPDSPRSPERARLEQLAVWSQVRRCVEERHLLFGPYRGRVAVELKPDGSRGRTQVDMEPATSPARPCISAALEAATEWPRIAMGVILDYHFSGAREASGLTYESNLNLPTPSGG